MRDGFYASKIHDPAAFGYSHTSGDWKGVKVNGGRGKLVSYKGAQALEAFLGARKNPIYEMAVTTGAIADFTRTAIGQSDTPPQDLASQRDNFKKKRRKNSSVNEAAHKRNMHCSNCLKSQPFLELSDKFICVVCSKTLYKVSKKDDTR